MVNRKTKDTVFTSLFRDKERVLKLYKDLHPKETDISVSDIEIQTLESVVANCPYNDLGFLVKNKYVLLIEAQSSWRVNITVRMLFYLCETLRRYIGYTEQSEHYPKKLILPEPELYVIYTGSQKVPEVLSLSEDFFNGSPNIELKVKVLNKVDKSTVFGQYIGYCKVFDEQRKLHNNGAKTANETFRICIEKGYLADFMNKHKEEAVKMMSELFDEDVIRMQYERAANRDLREKIAEGRAEGRAEGEVKGIIETAKNLLRMKVLSFNDISAATKLPLEKVKELSKQIWDGENK